MSDNTITEDDIRLTAYAVGEMDAEEATQFERLLADSPEARAEVDAIRAMGEKLDSEFAEELAAVQSPALTLVEPDVEAPVIADSRDGENVARPRFWVFGTVATGLAAMMMVAVFVRQREFDDAPGAYVATSDRTAPAELEMLQVNEPSMAGDALDAIEGDEAGKLIGNQAAKNDKVVADGVPELSNLPVTGALFGDDLPSDPEQESLTSLEEQVVVTGMKAKIAAPAIPKSPAPATASSAPSPAPPVATAAPVGRGKSRADDLMDVTDSFGTGGVVTSTSAAAEAKKKSGRGVSSPYAEGAAETNDFRRMTVAVDEVGAMAQDGEERRRRDAVALNAQPSEKPMALSKSSARAGETLAYRVESDATPDRSSRDESIAITAGARIVTASGSRGGNSYAPLIDNVFKDPLDEELSTFSIDVDTASYSQLRRTLQQNGQWPHRDQVRIEELINYFDYAYPAPDLDDVEEAHAAPFAVSLEESSAPWAPLHRLVRIGLKSAEIKGERPPANLVFLVDVSGSMNSADKLGLVQESLRELVPQLRAKDRVTMVAYAGRAGEVLEPTPGDDHETIQAAIDALSAGGSTNGAGGIKVAYQRAKEHFVEGGVNRVILATDGDFNVGMSSDDELVKLVENRAKSGVFLTVLGFGSGNLNDAMMEKITNKGNGNYFYVDGLDEGKKVLVEQMAGTLVTVAKDVKIQVDFNPAKIASYRLIGYANRMLNREDFDDDKVDAGEIGAGLTVTALYEVVPVGVAQELTGAQDVEGLKYQRRLEAGAEQDLEAERQEELADRGVELVESNELLTVKLRYKLPAEHESTLMEFPLVERRPGKEAKPSEDFSFASAVAAFGMRLRHSRYIDPKFSLEAIAEIAADGKGEDASGRRAQFIEMVRFAASTEPGANEDVRRAVQERLEKLR